MTTEQAIMMLKALQVTADEERGHREGDSILCAFLRGLGYESIVVEWEKIPKWYA